MATDQKDFLLHMLLHSNNIDNDRIILLKQLCTLPEQQRAHYSRTYLVKRCTAKREKKGKECLMLLKDYHFIETVNLPVQWCELHE